jgi:cbb3-type cytochrome oxidase subunit 3
MWRSFLLSLFGGVLCALLEQTVLPNVSSLFFWAPLPFFLVLLSAQGNTFSFVGFALGAGLFVDAYAFSTPFLYTIIFLGVSGIIWVTFRKIFTNRSLYALWAAISICRLLLFALHRIFLDILPEEGVFYLSLFGWDFLGLVLWQYWQQRKKRFTTQDVSYVFSV